MATDMLALYSADNLPHMLVKYGENRPTIHCARCGLHWNHGDKYQAAEGWSWVREEDKDPYSSESPEYSLVHLPGVQIWDVCKPRDIYINTYEMNREYGGPEEGGWYFDSWTAEDWRKVATYGRAEMFREALFDAYEEPLRGRGSVNYRGGDYQFRIEEHEAKDGDSYRPWC